MNKLLSFLLFALPALPLTVSANNIDTLISERLAQADSLHSLNQSDVAIQLLNRTRSLIAFQKASCEMQANLFHKIGVCHYLLDHNEEARLYWQDSTLPLRLSCLGKYHKETANSFYAISIAHRYLGNSLMEIEHMQQNLEILETLLQKDSADIAYKYLQAGSLYDNLGDYGIALNYYNHSKRYYDSIYNPDLSELAELLKVQGVANNHIGQYEKAIRLSSEAIDTYKKLALEEFHTDLAHCHQNISIAFLKIDNLDSAKKHAISALRINERFNIAIEKSKNLELLGVIQKRNGKYKQAMKFFEEAFKIRMKSNSTELQAISFENIADVHLLQGNIEKAISNYQSAISLLCPQDNPIAGGAPPLINGQPIIDRRRLLRVISLHANALLARFEKENKRDDLLLANHFFRCYDTLHTHVRQRYGEANSKYWLMQEAKPVFETALETALKLHELTGEQKYMEEAYLFSAKNKAAVLLDGLQDLDAKIAGIPTAILSEEQAAKQNYLRAERNFLKQKKGEDRPTLRSQMFEARRTYDKLIEKLEKEYPAYFNLKYQNSNSQTISELQSSLPIDAVILEYFIGERNIHLFLVEKEKIRQFSQPYPDGFIQNCLTFRELSDGSVQFQVDQFREVANALFHLLLAEPLNFISSEKKRIIIIPDEHLLLISFDVLPFREISKNKETWPYLIQKYAISMAYSNQLIFGKNTPEKLKEKSALFGGFGLEYDDLTLKSLRTLYGTDSLLKKRSGSRLPNSDDEVADIANLLNGDVWLNQSATKPAFLANAEKYRIIHLAMHALVDESQPLNSAMIFSQTDEKEDFILRASEIYGLRLEADMATLSACNTAHGQSTPEGVRSLGRAFAYAGCPSLVASLWYAHDAPTRKLMVAFYQNLKEGNPKDVAMQLAKLEYLEQASPTYSLPEYWSNFMVIGDTSPLVMEMSFPWVWLFAGLGILAAFFLFFWKRK